ncbi:MAG: UDP-N-acetylglucosamine 2-epimerase (non-hydrolyzing), partial [Bacillota bacterium]
RVGTDDESILAGCRELLNDPVLHRRMSGARNPYGDGRAAVRIADALEWHWGLRPGPVRQFEDPD